MSLLNQVLNDLEQRRAEAGSGRSLPRDVRPLPAAESSRRPLILGVIGLFVVLTAGVVAWIVLGPGRPLPEVTTVPAQAVINTALPPLTVPVQAAPASPDPLRPAAESGAALPLAVTPPAAEPRVPPAPRVVPPPSLKLSSQLSRLPQERANDATLSAPPSSANAKKPLTSGRGTTSAVVDSPIAENAFSGSIEKSAVDESPKAKAERLYRSALGLINQGRNDDGLTTLRAALREDATHVPARQILLKLYLDSRSWDAAQGILRDGLDQLPKQTPWAMLLARLLADRGDNLAALQVLEKHEAVAQSAADYQGALGAILQRLNRYAEAEQRYERASKVEAANGRWWLGLAMTRESQGKTAEAREAFQHAIATRNLTPDLQSYAEGKLK